MGSEQVKDNVLMWIYIDITNGQRIFSFTRSFTPMWNESLIYNEIYSYVLQREQDDPPTILFFEVYFCLIFSWPFFQFLVLPKM